MNVALKTDAMTNVQSSSLVFPALLLLAATPLSSTLSFHTGLAWLSPLVGGTSAWLFLWHASSRQASRSAIILVLLAWAATLSFVTVLLTVRAPESAAMAIPNAAEYWEEMKPYLQEGRGTEAAPRLFIPEHVKHLALFVVLAVISGGWLALSLGAMMTGYMSYYVAQAVMLADHPWLAGILAWHPWAVVRVAAFIMIGVALAALLLERSGLRAWLKRYRRWLLLGGILWMTDIGMKIVLAPYWWRVLRRAAGVDA